MSIGSVSDPDSFFTDPDPGFFPDPDPGNKKTNFSKAKTKFCEKFLFSTNQVGIHIKQRTFTSYHF